MLEKNFLSIYKIYQSKLLDLNACDFSDLILHSVKIFEKNFSKYTNQKFSVSCANGTDAIELILRGLGIGMGDEVIVPVNTYIATSFAVDNVGAKPVFVDCDDTFCMNGNPYSNFSRNNYNLNLFLI